MTHSTASPRVLRSGFTVLELLIVVALIGLVATFIVPKISEVKEQTYVAELQNDLRNAATSVEEYFATHGEYPTSGGLETTEGTLLREITETGENVFLGYINQDLLSRNYNPGGQEGADDQPAYVIAASHDNSDTVCILNHSANTETIASITVEPNKIVCGIP